MSWFEVIKNKRSRRNRGRGKPKAKPYNPHTGEGLRVSAIAERKKERQEERIKAAEEKPNKLPIGRVHTKHGGNSNFSRELANRRNKAIFSKDGEHSFNPDNTCAQCGNPISVNQRTLTRNNPSNLKYCKSCAKSIERGGK